MVHLYICVIHTRARASNGYDIEIAGSIDQRIIEETGRQHVEWNDGDDDNDNGNL